MYRAVDAGVSCPASPACRSDGFTLIELMVSLVLIGIIISFAVLSVGDNAGRALEQEAQRLSALISLAADESVLQSRDTGILFLPDGYSFFVLAPDNTWQSLNDDILRPRQLPPGMTLKLLLEGLPVELESNPETPKPQVFLLSSGERTPPFEIRLGLDDGRLEAGSGYRLMGPPVGELTLEASNPS